MNRISTVYRVPALEKAFDILDLIKSCAYGRSATELSHLLDLPYSTTFYILKVMETRGFVSRDMGTKRFFLGKRWINYESVASQNPDVRLRDTAAPFLERLVSSLGLTAHTALRQVDEAIYIDRRESSGYVKVNTWIGQHIPLHCTAVGKSLLLLLAPIDIASIFKGSTLPQFTKRTLTNVKALAVHLAEYRAMGYTVDDRESENEGVCVAAPILGPPGLVFGAIGVAGTIQQLSEYRLAKVGKQLRDFGQEISRRLGFEGDFPWSANSRAEGKKFSPDGKKHKDST
jgi:IclR family transcriptional regulator, KDG regulon repressor